MTKEDTGILRDDQRRVCEVCRGEGWVCLTHRDQKWNDGNPDCEDGPGCGSGCPCLCNVSIPPWAFPRTDRNLH